ncbi:MAG: YncE family protein [Gemmatimonadota bacterium]
MANLRLKTGAHRHLRRGGLAGALAITLCVATGCLGNTTSGSSDVLFALLVDPQYRKEHLTKFDDPTRNFCRGVRCSVKVEIIDLANHTRLGGFEVPSATRAADGSQTGYATSFAVSRFGDRVYIGEQLAEEVQAFSAGGVLLGSVPVGAGTGGPIDVVLSSNDSSLFVLDRRGISRIDAMTMTNIGRWNAPDEAVQNGLFPRLAVSPDGAKLVTTSKLSSGPYAYIVRSADMTLETLAAIDPVTSAPCEKEVEDLLFTSYGRLLALLGRCELIAQYDLPLGLYFSGFEIHLGGKNVGRGHLAYVESTDHVYTSVASSSDSTSELLSVTPATAVQSLGRVRGLITDVAVNTSGVAAYYAVSWSWNPDPHESRRLAVVHTPTGTLIDSVYFFPMSSGNEHPPRIMEVQIVRRAVAGDDAPPARHRP